MKKLLLVSVFFFANAEVLITDVDQPIPITEVSAVAGFKARLPCEVAPSSRGDVLFMVLWYNEKIDGEPVYSLDVRGRGFDQAKLWSDPNGFGSRALMNVNASPAELVIDDLLASDAGVYRCRVDFKNSPTRNVKIKLTVIVQPDRPVVLDANRRTIEKVSPIYNEGSNLTLFCETWGGSPSPRLTWYLGNEVMDDTYYREKDEVTVNRLDIPRITRKFFGARLVCLANNNRLVPPLMTEIVMNVNLKPFAVNITSKEPNLSAFRTYEINCTSFGSRPKAVITWWKGDHQVKHMARNFAEFPNVTKSILSYVPTIEDDGKYLTCRAENPEVPNSALEDRWHLVIHYLPIVTIRIGSSINARDIKEGDDVYFECNIKANPKAYKLSWFKNGKELHQNVSIGIIFSDRSLVLQSLTRHSTGDYTCLAANTEGKSSSEPVTLEVMYAPICKEGSVMQVVGALKHETISLFCGIQSRPPPTNFHWTFNNSGELVDVPSTRYSQVETVRLLTSQWHGSRLNYTPSSEMDYGTIACWARNQVGRQKNPCLFQIIVAGRPYPLHNCTAVQSTGPYAYRMGLDEGRGTDSREADWLIVRCTEGFDGGLPVTSFELEVYSEETVSRANTIFSSNQTDRLGSQGPIFEVPGLEPGRNYRLLLYAVNAKGKSDPVVLEPITLKGVAMYTTGRDSSENKKDYSLLVACFAGGVTAACILVVGVTLTLYRRSHPSRLAKVPQDADREVREYSELRKDEKRPPRDPRPQDLQDPSQDEEPDVIPIKVDRRPDIFEPTYAAKPERIKNFPSNIERFGYPSSPSSVLHGKDSWIYSEGFTERPSPPGNPLISPLRPNTLPVVRNHDNICTRSSRVQESSI
ncbi:titin [Neodiprion lecontei]|uniref:Titin n=1 Tax=Neodiprion lecontei TaxID=441921 RepID=A0ABM3GNQ1_NEOLC|nr:titin-like [Neodiprion fabricii]XP_046601891.1 titin [Neodiprion lecontei]